MKFFTTLLLALSIASPAFAHEPANPKIDPSLECRFSKNFQIDFTFHHTTEVEDEEENSEYYESHGDKHIVATVDYSPYQDGITVTISDPNTGISVTTSDYKEASIFYEVKEDTYYLNCQLIDNEEVEEVHPEEKYLEEEHLE